MPSPVDVLAQENANSDDNRDYNHELKIDLAEDGSQANPGVVLYRG